MKGKMVKIVVFVPEKNAPSLRHVMGEAGVGKVGSTYSHCSFSVKGIGRFLPLKGAHPTIGQVGKLEEVIEERIEMVCEKSKLLGVLKAIRAVHPYEEPVIDVYPLL